MVHLPCIAHLTYSTRPLLHSAYIAHKPAYITVWCSLFKISMEVDTNGYFKKRSVAPDKSGETQTAASETERQADCAQFGANLQPIDASKSFTPDL